MALGSDLALRLLITARDLTGGAVKSARDGIQSISTTAEKVFGAVKGFLTYRISVEGGGQLLNLADNYEQLKTRIGLTTQSQAEFNTAQGELFRIAQETRSDLASTVGLYARIDRGIRALGGAQRDSLALTEAIAQSFQVSGASASESAAGIQQLSQALGSGVLRGDEFNSVMENAPRLAQAMADGLGVPISSLRQMAEAGELTAERVALTRKNERLAESLAASQAAQRALDRPRQPRDRDQQSEAEPRWPVPRCQQRPRQRLARGLSVRSSRHRGCRRCR